MSKITLNNVSSFTDDTTAVSIVNNNSNTIQTALDNTLSRDGTSPNQMAATLDMNSNRIINLPAPISLSEPMRLQDAQTLTGAGTITVGAVPNGGTTGQVLNKTSNADQAVGWADTHYVPAGGTTGQYLAKSSNTDYSLQWSTLPTSALPSTVLVLATLTSLSSTSVSGSITSIIFLGYSTQGDCPTFTFKKVSTPLPFNLGCKQSLDGTWWQYVAPSEGVDARVFGVKPDWDNTNTQLASGGGDTNATDNATFLQNALDFAAIQFSSGFDSGGGAGHRVLVPHGTSMIGSTITVPDGVWLKGTGLYNCVLKMKNTFDPTRNFINLGTQDNVNAICNSQSRATAGSLVINGNLATGGVATFVSKSIVSIWSTGNDSGITFTVHGTDGDGQTQVEVISGTNAGRADTGFYYKTVDAISTSGATAGNVNAGRNVYASFDSRIEDIWLWSNHMNATSGTSMVYTSNTQHTGGLARVQISAGNRSAIRFVGGIGGASTFTLEDINCGNYGNMAGVVSNNPCIYMNYAGLNSPMQRIVVSGNALGAAGGVGIELAGGQLNIQDVHVENCGTGIKISSTTANNGLITIQAAIGSGLMTDFIQIASTASAISNGAFIALQNIMPNGATNTLNDLRSGGTGASGSIFINTWTYK